MSDTDLQLLARYTRHHVEDAFAEVVRRHLDLVHSAALRQVRSPQLAEEVAQSVFADLARNAHRLTPDTILTAWLYQVTRRTAIDVVRREARRQLREQIATEMNTLNATAADWMHIEPLLDEAMHALDDADRAAVLLRYFENKSLREVGQTLGTSDDTAQKRVSRAVERLREFFAKRGVTVGPSGLIIVISANAVQAAPVGLAVTIASAAALAGTMIATTASASATKAIAMTTLQKITIGAALVATVGIGINEAQKASTLQSQLQKLQQRQAPLAGKIQQLQTERDDAMKQLAALKDQIERSKSNSVELLRLRGEAASLRSRLAAKESDFEKLTTESIHGQFRPRTDWSDKGNQDPFATVETMLWASSQKQRDRLEDVATPQALADTAWPLFPHEQPPILTVGAVHLISTVMNQQGTRAAVTAFVREDFLAPPGGGPYSVNKLQGWQLIKSDSGWKISKMLFFDTGHN
jgi:RNA polymerase sigma factor (sigma-70 family)